MANEQLIAALATEVERLRDELSIATTPKCFSCGALVTEICPRALATPCGRQHLGGTRAARALAGGSHDQ
jgi:hypothetical protein